MPEETKKVLERLANRPDVFVAIVSGRSVADVKSKVGIDGELPQQLELLKLSSLWL